VKEARLRRTNVLCFLSYEIFISKKNMKVERGGRRPAGECKGKRNGDRE
jgi:hypothetical protein